jgi:predicted small metal-binding protein
MQRPSARRAGETDDEVLREAAEHARAHGIPEATSELMERVKADVSDA